jgi:hypothetical protein
MRADATMCVVLFTNTFARGERAITTILAQRPRRRRLENQPGVLCRLANGRDADAVNFGDD